MTPGRATDQDKAGRRVIIVGGGFSAVAAAAQLLARGAAHVTLIERGAAFGPGLAYGPAAGAHLLNTPAARMSAIEGDGEHFVRWLARHGAGEGYVRRALYGAYLRDTLRDAARARWLRPSRLECVRGAAIACRREGDHWLVTLASGRAYAAQAVILALGHPAPAPPAPFEAHDLIGAWDTRAQARLRKGDVLLAGSGLTMMDVAVALAARRRGGMIYALSRRGRTPQAHLSPPGPPAAAAAEPPLELSAALHQFRARAGQDWRPALDALRPHAPELWARLGPERQGRFLRHLRPWWDSHRHRAPPETAAQFAALLAEGRVRILSGEITSAIRERGVWRLQHRQRGSRVRHRLETVGVINCAGADLALARSQDALVRQLLDEGLARAPANGLGFDVDPENRLRDKAGAAQPNLFVLGPLAAGVFWETTAAPELRARAAAIARALD